jgi:hypothetical protein
MMKEKPSKLDPFEDSLLGLAAGKITLAEMRHWLSGHAVSNFSDRLSNQLPFV